MFGAKPRFFDEFAGGGPAGVFSLLYAASHQFPEELAGGMAVLADKKDAAVRQEGQDNYGPGMGNDFASGTDAPGFYNFIAANAEDRAFVDDLAAQDLGMGRFSFGHRFLENDR